MGHVTYVSVDVNSDYYVEDDVSEKCVNFSDGSLEKCITVSTDGAEKCITVTADIPSIDVFQGSNNEDCSEILDLPEVSLTKINDEDPVQYENLEILESDPFGKYPTLQKYYVKDNDIITYTIDNHNTELDYYVYTSADNVGWLFERPSEFAVYNADDGTVTLNVGNQLEGIDLELWVWAINENDCMSDCAIYYVETMVRSNQPVLYIPDEVYYISTSIECIIENYINDCKYKYTTYCLQYDDDNEYYLNVYDNINNPIFSVDIPNDVNCNEFIIQIKAIEYYKYASFETELQLNLKSVTQSGYVGVEIAGGLGIGSCNPNRFFGIFKILDYDVLYLYDQNSNVIGYNLTSSYNILYDADVPEDYVEYHNYLVTFKGEASAKIIPPIDMYVSDVELEIHFYINSNENNNTVLYNDDGSVLCYTSAEQTNLLEYPSYVLSCDEPIEIFSSEKISSDLSISFSLYFK